MMSYQDPPQSKLFYIGINIDKRIRKNHPLRKIRELIDFNFIYNEVKDKYGYNGNESIPPPVILKLMLLLVLYNVRSERELMDTLGERLDWLWFLGFDLDTEIPNHSVLSKARRRWGEEAFRSFYERVVWQCVESGLVDGRKIFVDSSLVQADASNNSVVDRQSLKRYLNESYKELEKRLEEEVKEDDRREDNEGSSGGVNKRYISTTDPDASIVRTGGTGKAKLRYQTHRAVDGAYEVITATEVTPGEVNEAHMMVELIESHQLNTETNVDTVVADSKYGTISNYLGCYDRGIRAHIPDLNEVQMKGGRMVGIFSDDLFIYDEETDTFTCPMGKRLRFRAFLRERQSVEYIASKKDCGVCELRSKCTTNKVGRTIKRHLRQEELDYMRYIAGTTISRNDIKTRQHLMERSFARSKRYGFGRARWRRLWRLRIQEYLTAAIQNMQILMKYGNDPRRAVSKAKESIYEKLSSLSENTERFLSEFILRIKANVKVDFVFSD
jgi:transposase